MLIFSTTSFSFEDCNKLVSKLRPIILHANNTHEHFPKVILEASNMYAGFNFTHLYDVQGYEKLIFLSTDTEIFKSLIFNLMRRVNISHIINNELFSF